MSIEERVAASHEWSKTRPRKRSSALERGLLSSCSFCWNATPAIRFQYSPEGIEAGDRFFERIDKLRQAARTANRNVDGHDGKQETNNG